MRNLAATIAILTTLTGCAEVLSFIGATARPLGRSVLACIPATEDPTPEQASACLESALGVVDEATDHARGAKAIECAHAIREAGDLERSGEDASEPAARAEFLLDGLRR